MLAGLPGFRTGTRWKQFVALFGYAIIFMFLFAGITRGQIGPTLVGLVLLASVLLVGNAWGLRSRAPLFGSSNRLLSAGGWAGLVVLGFVGLALIQPSPQQPPSVAQVTPTPIVQATAVTVATPVPATSTSRPAATATSAPVKPVAVATQPPATATTRPSPPATAVPKVAVPTATTRPVQATATPRPAAPAPTAPSSNSVYYASCAAARAAGAAPLYRGQPGYRAALDRDNDGVACE